MEVLPLLIILLGFLCGSVSGSGSSTITMSKSPDTIKPLLTSEMTLSCMLNKTQTAAPSGGLVGRKRRSVDDIDLDSGRDLDLGTTRNLDLSGDHDPQRDPQPRSVSDVVTSTEDIAYISSIVVMKSSGEKIAMMTEHTPPRLLMPDVTNAVVTGGITGAGGDVTGYLQITWELPTEAETGDYVCEMTTVARDGTGMGFRTTLQVTATTPSITDLIGHINQMRKENAEQKAQLAQQMATHKANVSDLQAQLQHQADTHKAELQQQSEVHKANMSDMQSQLQQQISNIKDTFSHVENGTLVYYKPSTWPSTDVYTYMKNPHYKPGMRYKDISVTFSKPYSTPPAVSWSIGAFYDWTKNVDYAIELREVTTTGFTLRASCLDSSDYMFYHIVIEWLSIP